MRGLISNKKGAAHFEMIISFVFFVGFVLFLFMVLQPQDTSTLSGAVISGLYDSFEEKVHTNLSSMLLRANYDLVDSPDCFVVDLPQHVFNYNIAGSKSVVRRITGEDVNSDLENGLMESYEYDYVAADDNGGFFRVAISPEFEDDGIGGCIEPIGFDIGQPVERRVISYSALENMESRYRNEYEILRKELGVPPIFDFAIASENLRINMEPQFGIPDAVEVMAQDRIVEVLRVNGTVINERFTLKIW